MRLAANGDRGWLPHVHNNQTGRRGPKYGHDMYKTSEDNFMAKAYYEDVDYGKRDKEERNQNSDSRYNYQFPNINNNRTPQNVGNSGNDVLDEFYNNVETPRNRRNWMVSDADIYVPKLSNSPRYNYFDNQQPFEYNEHLNRDRSAHRPFDILNAARSNYTYRTDRDRNYYDYSRHNYDSSSRQEGNSDSIWNSYYDQSRRRYEYIDLRRDEFYNPAPTHSQSAFETRRESPTYSQYEMGGARRSNFHGPSDSRSEVGAKGGGGGGTNFFVSLSAEPPRREDTEYSDFSSSPFPNENRKSRKKWSKPQRTKISGDRGLFNFKEETSENEDSSVSTNKFKEIENTVVGNHNYEKIDFNQILQDPKNIKVTNELTKKNAVAFEIRDAETPIQKTRKFKRFLAKRNLRNKNRYDNYMNNNRPVRTATATIRHVSEPGTKTIITPQLNRESTYTILKDAKESSLKKNNVGQNKKGAQVRFNTANTSKKGRNGGQDKGYVVPVIDGSDKSKSNKTSFSVCFPFKTKSSK